MVKFLKSPSILILLLGLVWIIGCQKYGPVSTNTYQYAKSLYSICNMKDAERLSKFVEQVKQDQEVPSSELQWILDIATLAENGDWSKAAKRSRQMMMDQVGN